MRALVEERAKSLMEFTISNGFDYGYEGEGTLSTEYVKELSDKELVEFFEVLLDDMNRLQKDRM